jgi:nanoRNase/pAp phosphatase (c-di-AMP/oligoRNAs hydrolase)
VVQAHDFPDHDAISSAFALGHLLSTQGINTRLVYNGVVDRVSLQKMIEILSIPVIHASEAGLTEDDKIITVDGCIGEKNVTDLPGDEIAAIDHHEVIAPPGLWFSDIRPEYGATATIIYEYYLDAGEIIPRDIATALQVGLAIDTANLTRGFVGADLRAFEHFHGIADQDLVGRICRNSMLHGELIYYQKMLDVLDRQGNVAFAWLKDGCPKNMLGILGDFILALDEVDVVILAATSGQCIQLSLRSENHDINVAKLVREVAVLNGIGFGGGHSHMAGGLIDQQKLYESPLSNNLFKLFLDKIDQ